jgi:membrane-associated phospholipid phosphatase
VRQPDEAGLANEQTEAGRVQEQLSRTQEPFPERLEADVPEHFDVQVDVSYLWDGGALPFLFGSGALALGLRLFASPASSPLLFPNNEGVVTSFGNTVPELAVGLGVGAGAGLMALMPGIGRWHHLKGYAEATVSTIALTEVVKNLVGRQRPHYQPGDTDPDHRRSFFSGHSSIAAATTVYLGLYLGKHVLPRIGGHYGPAARALVYGALGAAFVGIPYSRLHDNRHHLGDVLAGSAVGTVIAVSFFAYQESRLLESQEEFYLAKRRRMMVLPDVQNRGLHLVTVW